MTANSTVNITSVEPRLWVTNSGMTTWKLNASVPTIAIITSGTHSSGTERA